MILSPIRISLDWQFLSIVTGSSVWKHACTFNINREDSRQKKTPKYLFLSKIWLKTKIWKLFVWFCFKSEPIPYPALKKTPIDEPTYEQNICSVCQRVFHLKSQWLGKFVQLFRKKVSSTVDKGFLFGLLI